MNSTPTGNRIHIAIFGKRNAGKSTLINKLTNQSIAVVSEVPGTTTDPVYKAMELLPLGPVIIIDTAGFDDIGELGNLRVEKTYDVLRKTDLAILVVNAIDGIQSEDLQFINKAKQREIPIVLVFNKIDLGLKRGNNDDKLKDMLIPVADVNSKTGEGIDYLKKLIIDNAKYDHLPNNIVGDLIKPGDFIVLVTPIDKGAPKGRLILPQQQVIRDIIDSDAVAIVAKENNFKEVFLNLKIQPSLVITDSQVFSKVDEDTPPGILLTSFSILFARYKGDLYEMVKGLKAIEKLGPGSKVLIVEGCTHHRQSDDIGKVKIPRWIRQFTGNDIEFEWASGTYYPKEIESFDAIIHCGGCMLNNREMMYRIQTAREKNVAITNYGILIAYVHGLLKRALGPFPEALRILEEGSSS